MTMAIAERPPEEATRLDEISRKLDQLTASVAALGRGRCGSAYQNVDVHTTGQALGHPEPRARQGFRQTLGQGHLPRAVIDRRGSVRPGPGDGPNDIELGILEELLVQGSDLGLGARRCHQLDLGCRTRCDGIRSHKHIQIHTGRNLLRRNQSWRSGQQ